MRQLHVKTVEAMFCCTEFVGSGLGRKMVTPNHALNQPNKPAGCDRAKSV